MIPKKWVFLNERLDEDEIQGLINCVNMPKFLAVALLNRKIGPKKIEDFLRKSIGKVPHPNLLKDMDKAVIRIEKALINHEKIVVYGDYDVDGITSTAILYDFLKSEGADVSYYIPNRQDEGYGINILALQKIKKLGASLMITVDCGITASGEVEFAKTLGLDIIITDHHMCYEKVPKAVAVINPKQADDSYPFSELAGVGVCFKLMLALAIKFGKKANDYFQKYIDICAIGTIADVVPLIEENRIIVSAGLKRLRETERPGLRALLSMAGLDNKEINATTVSFGIAPRINAAGRVGKVEMGVKLLLETDEERAVQIAEYLNKENIARQQTEKKILEDVSQMIAQDSNFSKKKAIVLAKEGWHQGIIGIVASRLVEKYYKPTILISIEKGVGKGSGRSIEGINLFDALGGVSDMLIKYGGHELAAGLSIRQEDIQKLSDYLEQYIEDHLTAENIIPSILIDEMIEVGQIRPETVKILENSLAPFGAANPEPLFALTDSKITAIRKMGDSDKHVRLQVEKNGKQVICVGFSMSWIADTFSIGDTVDIAFCMNLNQFRGEVSVQAILKDMKLSKKNYA